jgi:hypothetical protein
VKLLTIVLHNAATPPPCMAYMALLTILDLAFRFELGKAAAMNRYFAA